MVRTLLLLCENWLADVRQCRALQTLGDKMEVGRFGRKNANGLKLPVLPES